MLYLLSRFGVRLATFVGAYRAVLQLFGGAIALVLGYWGFHEIFAPKSGWDYLTNFFRTLQLITLHFPSTFEANANWQLQIARLLLPLVAVSATFHILIGGVTRPLRLAMLPRARDHVILVGDRQMSDAALERLVADKRQVAAVAATFEPSRRDTLEGLGLTVVEADPKQAATYASLNPGAARGVFIATPDDLDNINIALLALRAIDRDERPHAPVALAVRVDREDLARELDAALDGLSGRRRMRYHRLCPDRDGLRIELARYAPVFTKPDRDAASHALVVGLQGRWEQALAQLIVALQDHPTKRPVLTLSLREDEKAALARWRGAHPDLDLVAALDVLDAGPQGLPDDAAAAACVAAHGAPHLAVILLDGADAIAAALALRRPTSALGTATTPILVRQTSEDHLFAALAQTVVKGRDHSRIVPFSGPVRAESVARALDRKGDEMAMALHAAYLDNAARLEPGSLAAIAAWDELPENLREANRASADHMPILFASEGVALKDKAAVARAVADPATLERLARVEHRRWMADRIERGWRSGPARDDARLIHPSIRDFDALSVEDKEKDRNAVRKLAEIAAG
ncbi:MAG TPA: RyR domain-containing protein [Rhodoblastus sp.]|nr:RyR domain-containing protein [Rhodoblastus sp.]